MAPKQIDIGIDRPNPAEGSLPGDENDPLSPEQSHQLSDIADVVRDPVHGDIRLTALERCLVDSREFQRLKDINQLATTQLAYPGALHTRFLHSLGVLHVCSQMIATCFQNASIYSRVARPGEPAPLKLTPYQVLLARLVALLHDLAHVPFGHTLVGEGHVFEHDEWQDRDRVTLIEQGLEHTESDFLRKFKQFLTGHKFPTDKTPAIEERQVNALWEELKSIFKAEKKDIDSLRYPFVHDLVSNTICADLIDYVQRDMYFCGLKEGLGDRFLDYLAVVPTVLKADPDRGSTRHALRVDQRFAFASCQGETETGTSSCRLVLLLYRYNERRQPVPKHNIVDEAIDLVRRRYMVADKLYYHRTKTTGAAMLACSAYSAGLTVEDLWDKCDSEVLKHLAGLNREDERALESEVSERTKSRPKRARLLADKLRQRQLFKPIYRTSYREPDEFDQESNRLWKTVIPTYSKAEACSELISILEKIVGLAATGNPEDGVGTVCVYCPDSNMNLKFFEMLVLRDPSGGDCPIEKLQDTANPQFRSEINLIQNSHKRLWRLEVCVDPSLLPAEQKNSDACQIAAAIAAEIGLPNEIQELSGGATQNLAQLQVTLTIDSVLEKYNLKSSVKHEDRQRLVVQSSKCRGSLSLVESRIKESLAAWGYEISD